VVGDEASLRGSKAGMLAPDDSAGSEIRHIGDIVALGQSVWFDNIRRGLLTSGEFERTSEGN